MLFTKCTYQHWNNQKKNWKSSYSTVHHYENVHSSTILKDFKYRYSKFSIEKEIERKIKKKKFFFFWFGINIEICEKKRQKFDQKEYI